MRCRNLVVAAALVLLLCGCNQLGPHPPSTVAPTRAAVSPSSAPRSTMAPPAKTDTPSPTGGTIAGATAPIATPVPTLSAPTIALRWVDSLSFIDPDDGWALGRRCPGNQAPCRAALWQTTDGGEQWQVTGNTVPAPASTSFRPGWTDSGLLFISQQDGWIFGRQYGTRLYRTRDGGATWSAMAMPASVFDLSYADGTLWAALADSCSPGSAPAACQWQMLESIDRGQSWHPLPSRTPLPDEPVVLIRRDSGRAWLFGNQLERTVDGGHTWVSRNLPADCHRPGPYFFRIRASLAGNALWLLCAGQESAGGEARGIYISTDAGDTWRVAFPPGRSPSGLDAAGYSGTIEATTSNSAVLCLREGPAGGPVLATADGGLTWNWVLGHHDAYCTTLLAIDSQYSWIADVEEISYPVYGTFIWRTVDGGAHWQRVALP